MTLAADADSVVSPTYVPDLAHTCLDLLIDGERGLWHLANGGAVSWAELARLAARLHGLDETLINAPPTRSLNLAAPRPAHSALSSLRGASIPPLADALARYTCERETPKAALSQAPPRQALPAHPYSRLRS